MSAENNMMDDNVSPDINDEAEALHEQEGMNTNENAQEGDDKAAFEEALEAQKNKYLRLLADFENYKKRTNSERLDLIQTAGKDIIVAFLEVIDDMDRAEVQIEKEENAESIKEGVLLVFNKLRKLLFSKGVKAIESVNEDFDAAIHEAVANVPVPNEKQKGKIVDEIQKGYTLNDKIIRYPKVVVGN